ncbi:MAG: elongation factor P--(R)-beta-lysine ligase [Arsenophonus sp. NC-XBC3-MAG3]
MSEIVNWQPRASINNLLKRAKIMAEIRRFFIDRGVVEVETPILSKFTVTDIHLLSFETQFVTPIIANNTKLYMITSPEYHMKRLLAAGSGPIYQIIKAFRNQEQGRYHNPEFTMLEWYRPHYDMYRLIDEVDDFLQQILDCQPTERISYQQAFQRYLNIDPIAIELEKKQLHDAAVQLGLNNTGKEENKDVLLQFLFTIGVEPNLGKYKPTVIYHFPASQAALAKISKEDNRVSERFEVYFKGIELANGFRELTDAEEQRKRFEHDNQMREKMGLPKQAIDERFLAALGEIIPDCSGVALGIDRLVMFILNAEKISDVISFSIELA